MRKGKRVGYVGLAFTSNPEAECPLKKKKKKKTDVHLDTIQRWLLNDYVEGSTGDEVTTEDLWIHFRHCNEMFTEESKNDFLYLLSFAMKALSVVKKQGKRYLFLKRNYPSNTAAQANDFFRETTDSSQNDNAEKTFFNSDELEKPMSLKTTVVVSRVVKRVIQTKRNTRIVMTVSIAVKKMKTLLV